MMPPFHNADLKKKQNTGDLKKKKGHRAADTVFSVTCKVISIKKKGHCTTNMLLSMF